MVSEKKVLIVILVFALAIISAFSLTRAAKGPAAPKVATAQENTMITDAISQPQSATSTPISTFVPEKPTLESAKKKGVYSAIIKTSAGDITVSLNYQATPLTASNFMNLSEGGFYNNTIFHRIIDGFMIQGGDPKGDGTGGPGYKFDDEAFTGEYTRGTVAMANAGPDTNGSQFFIMHKDAPLPKNYVIFGKVTKGIEVVDKIATAPVTMSSSGENSKPVSPVVVTTVEIVDESPQR
jgi:cyclophilin family peptidyl-prolyl cis-trans isomerase